MYITISLYYIGVPLFFLDFFNDCIHEDIGFKKKTIMPSDSSDEQMMGDKRLRETDIDKFARKRVRVMIKPLHDGTKVLRKEDKRNDKELKKEEAWRNLEEFRRQAEESNRRFAQLMEAQQQAVAVAAGPDTATEFDEKRETELMTAWLAEEDRQYGIAEGAIIADASKEDGAFVADVADAVV